MKSTSLGSSQRTWISPCGAKPCRRELPEYNEFTVSTSTHHDTWQERLEWTLRARWHVLILEDDQGARASIIDALDRHYRKSTDYTASRVRVTEQGTDTAFVRHIVASVGLPPQRSRYRLFRDFEAYCGRQYAVDQRVLLLIDDAQHLRLGTMRVLHSLSTIVVGHDLAVQMVMVGGSEIIKQMRNERWRAMESRIGLRMRWPSRETKAS